MEQITENQESDSLVIKAYSYEKIGAFKEARDIFGINPGDYIVCLGDVKKGLALIKADVFQEITDDLLNRGDGDESN